MCDPCAAGGVLVLDEDVPAAASIQREPPLGKFIHELIANQTRHQRFDLADAEELTRVPFFYPAGWPEPGSGPYGALMVAPDSRRYRCPALVAYAFSDVHVLGADGIIMLADGVVKDTLAHVATWHDDSNVEELRDVDFVRLRQPMPVIRAVDDARYVIGYNGAWRNHGHWLPQCLPRLYAFTLLRRRYGDIKIALPPLPAGSAQARTVKLLGIEADQIYTVPANTAVHFASAILMPDFDIWDVSSFATAAADAVVAGLPTKHFPDLALPPKVYVRRTVAARRVANFDALKTILDRYGFVVRSFENMDFAAQIATMRSADYVISEHGAGTANVVFCRSGAAMLELFNPVCVQPAYWTLASRRGLEFAYLVGDHVAGDPDAPPTWDSAYDIAPDKLEAAIRAMLRVVPAPLANAPAASTPPGFHTLAHVGQVGDVRANPGEWIGVRGRAIEGFELRPLPELSRHNVRYRALLPDRNWSAWASAGDFCGSRGATRPLLGFEVRLSGRASELFELRCSAQFASRPGESVVADSLCGTPVDGPLEAMQVLVSQRLTSPPDQGDGDELKRRFPLRPGL